MAEENQKQSSDSEKQVDFGYRAVPESEKEYDRNTAATTLKMAIKMGYEIKKKR